MVIDLVFCIEKLRFICDDKSKINMMPFGLIAEIYLPEGRKLEACESIAKALSSIEDLGVQSILAVMDDDDNRYANLIASYQSEEPAILNADTILGAKSEN